MNDTNVGWSPRGVPIQDPGFQPDDGGTLVYYDGPLAYISTRDGVPFLCWDAGCSKDRITERFVCIPIAPTTAAWMREGDGWPHLYAVAAKYRELVRTKAAHVIDYRSGEVIAAWLVDGCDIPEDVLPSPSVAA